MLTKKEVTDVVFIIHGIRDQGFWTKKIGRKIKRKSLEAFDGRNRIIVYFKQPRQLGGGLGKFEAQAGLRLEQALTDFDLTTTGSTFGSSQVGAFSLGGSNTATFTVGVTFPAALSGGSATLAYNGAWAQSSTQGSGYTLVSGTTYNGTGSGSGPFTHYFRVGGTVSGIAGSTTNGVYTGNVAITGSCN